MSLKVLDSKLRNAELLKKQQENALALQSIPNSELTHSKCACGSVTWQPTMILFTIPALHPKNSTGRHINRAENVLVCTECKKAHPDQLDPQDGAYIENLPNELKGTVTT